MSGLHHRLRLARRGLGYAAAITLVAMALVAAAVSQLLPLAERHPDRVAAWLSERLGRPVAFDRVETEWTRRGPLLRLDELRVGNGDQAIAIGDAEMLISQYAGLLPGRSFTELRLRGLDLTLQRSDDGRWTVRGLPGQRQASDDPFAALEGLGELQVIGGKLTVLAPQLGIQARLPEVDVRLQVDGDRVRVGMRAWMEVGKSPLVAVADFGREQGNGGAYVAAREADLSVWAPLLHMAGVVAEAGQGRGEAWAQLQDHRVTAVTIDTSLEDLVLRGAALADGSLPRAHFQSLSARADWRTLPGGWRLDAPRLRIGSVTKGGDDKNAGSREQVLDGLVLAGGARYAAMAERIEIAPLLRVAALSDRMAPALRQWVVAARPQGRGSKLRFSTSREGLAQVSGRIDGFGFDPVGDAPGLHGLAGVLHGDGEGFNFVFDDQASVRVDWPRGFGVPHDVRLRGTLAGWHDGSGWRVGTSDLQVKTEGFGAGMRGGLWFQGDGSQPRIDLAVSLDPMSIPSAKRFWVRHRMSPKAIEWLDAALVDGRVEDARALISGDLDDWPFRDHDGRFEATARLRDAVLKFHPDWPAAEHVDGEVRFIADGFDVSGKAVLADVGIRHFDAAIPHFGQAQLAVHAQGGGDASRLLGLLRQSPLQQEYGQTLDNLEASGLASVTFDLEQPLHAGGGNTRLGGTVALSGARLAEQRWDLAFTDVRGRARYDRGGFIADQLSVRFNDRAGQPASSKPASSQPTQGTSANRLSPGKLSLRAGRHVRDARQGFEAELEANLAARDLLVRAPQLDWLHPYIDGRSPWSIAVTIPKAAANASAPPARLRLRSSLVGTELTLPAPLDKPAGTALVSTVDASLPLDKGEIAVAFGDRLALRARSDARGTGVRVVLGDDKVVEAPPVSGLIATGRTDRLDAIDWATLSSVGGQSGGSDPGGSGGLSLRMVDITAAHLLLLGADFPDIRVRAMPAAGAQATRMQLDGATLLGTVQLPQATGAAINGQFQRVHWRSLKPAQPAAVDTASAAAGKTRDDVDPSKVPPLQLSIDDLRFGDARLGAASLRTRPTASGLQVEQLQTRAPGQRIDASGEWTGRSGATRTRLRIAVDSDDFGKLLAGFGYGGQVSGGDGRATLDAGWTGSAANFRLDALDGNLDLDIRDGQLVEVEPGAGRVLGLLSIAQLPRRLTLDFRDFFSKGFAFDKLAGDVRLGGGKARTEALVIDGPAARIQISGAADLRAQTFDQTILVLPKAGNLLTAVGAIAGGPVGAAIGAAANAVLKKPLGQLAAKTYHVSGPWKDPKVEVTSRDQSRIQTATAAPPAG